MNTLDITVHIGGIILSVFLLYWAGIRLNCLFFSAFEFAQASLIMDSLPIPLRIVGIQHWLYCSFFEKLKSVLLLLYYSSLIFLAAQSFFRDAVLYCISAFYTVIGLFLMMFWYRNRVICRDRKRHIPYNTFAPLHEKQRRELNTARNCLRLSGLLQRWNLLERTSESSTSPHKREVIIRKFQNY